MRLGQGRAAGAAEAESFFFCFLFARTDYVRSGRAEPAEPAEADQSFSGTNEALLCVVEHLFFLFCFYFGRQAGVAS